MAVAEPRIEVACGVLVDGDRILIARRPTGKIGAGKWEFPGGKIEAGESAHAALVRELEEELGVRVGAAEALARLHHDYHDRNICLDAWRVAGYSGTPHPREGQQLAWVLPCQAPSYDLLASSWRVLAALRLPRHYVFTPPAGPCASWLSALECLPQGCWLRLRRPALGDAAYFELSVRVAAACRAFNIPLVVDRPAAIAAAGAAGLHLDGARLRACSARPLGHEMLCIASVHNAQELAHAYALGMDAAVLSPLYATRSHPGSPGMGNAAFADRARDAGLPVYALGGVGPDAFAQVRALGGFGVAGISAYWPGCEKSSESSARQADSGSGSPAMK